MGMPVAPAYTQSEFRVRDSVTDPSGVDAAFDAGDTAQNGNWTQDVDTMFRVRFQVEQTVATYVNDADGQTEFRLQYNNTTQATGWVDVGGTADTEDVRLRVCTGYADGDNITTSRLTGGGGSLVTGDGIESTQTSDTVTFTEEALSYTELEFALEIMSSQVDDADSIQLRLIHSAGDEVPPATVLDSYAQTPTITVNEVGGGLGIPIVMHHRKLIGAS